MADKYTVRMRRGSFVLGTSMVAIASAFASPASAACDPDPTVAGGTTTCTGIDSDGVSVGTRGTVVNVVAGARVDGQILVGIANGSGWDLERVFVDVQGRVDGGNGAGISVFPAVTRPGSFSYPEGTEAVITVGTGAVVTGTTGIQAPVIFQNPFSRSVLTIDNAGTISGTSGIAVAADSDGFGTGSNIVNRLGGTIGAIRGPVGRLDNAGTIDGGTLSAIDTTTSFDELSGVRANSGTIRSRSNAATVQNITPAYAVLLNTGTITNSGSGAALGGRNVRLNNGTGAVITGGTNGVAIDATDVVTLVNSGRIEGDVVARGTFAGAEPSTIDSVDGIINGDLRLGQGNDTLFARIDALGALNTGITGAINGGGGTDTLRVLTSGGATIDTLPVLFTGFERLGFEVAEGDSVVLGANFVAAVPVIVTGAGTLTNRGTIEAAGEVLSGTGAYINTITNEGTIRSTATMGYDFAVRTDGEFTNAGTVEAVGRGVYTNDAFTNSGTVIAGNTGVISYGGISNSGTIRSTNGVGLEIYGFNGGIAAPQNSGLIEGRVAGMVLNGALVNSGTIRSTGTGVAFNYGSASIVNASSGIIAGGTQAIGTLNGGSLYNAVVQNAGTINGDVNLGGAGQGYSYNRFFAEDGGVLNGNLRLGATDVLVTGLVNDGAGQFAGISGTVFANGASLRYRVTADATTVHGPAAGFGSTGYEIAEGATLVLTGSGTSAQTLVLAGAGKADVAIDIATQGKQAILVTAATRTDGGTPIPTAMDVISRGNLTMERVAGDYTAASTAVMLTGQTFTNAGTITVRETGTPLPNPYGEPRPAAIRNDLQREGIVINDGTINLARAVGVYNVASLTNNGSILQVAGGASTAARDVLLVTNRGTINTDGVALQEVARVENLAGGTIASESGFAIQSYSGHVTNAGTITGTVDVGYYRQFDGTPGRGFGSGTYVAAGGTVSGDVLFGDADDVFVLTGEETGVSGIVDGARGDDTLAHIRGTDATVSLDARPGIVSFEHAAVEASAAGVTVTVTAGANHAGDLFVGGAGTVVNNATIAGAVYTWPDYGLYDTDNPIATTMAAFENRGTISGGVSGTIASFTNAGTVTALADDPYGAPFYGVQLYGRDTTSLINTGTITAAPQQEAVGMGGDGGSTVLNTGTITGDVWFAGYAMGGDRFENRGTMAGLAWMGTGDDVFVQVAGAKLEAAIGGAGNDLFVMRADANGSLAANQVYGFERLQQTGTQTITYLGAFAVPTIELAGGTLLVDAGGALGTTGATTVTGGDAGVTVINRGRIVGGVQFGAGDDTYLEGAGSTVRSVDGGAGRDTYGVLLSGDRQGIGARSGFERLSVTGPGTLSLTLDQDFAEVALAGANLSVLPGTFTIGALTGSDAAEQVLSARDLAAVSLGSGDDLLTLPVTEAAGRYDGGAGADRLRFTGAGTTVLRGSVLGFESIAVAGDALRVTGTLGKADDRIALEGAARPLLLADGGTIAGTVNLGAGDNIFAMTAGGLLTGAVDGGAGTDIARFDLSRALSLPTTLTGFEVLETSGAGTLTLGRGNHVFDRVAVAGSLAVAADAVLTAPRVSLGAGASRLDIAGRFAGSVSGTGNDDIVRVTGGSAAAPVAFAGLDSLAALQLAGGWSTISGRATANTITLTGGTLTGLTGSTIVANTISVGQGAVFGSAGTVAANIAVDGTLSPGASPGTMVVNGNVTLAQTSVTLLEIAPAQSDRLAINGTLTIAPGATLQLTAAQRIMPGQSLDLITASVRIDGAFTSVVKSADLFGFIVQDADSISLLGQFMDDPAFAPQVRGTIAYVNDLLTTGRASLALLAAAPSLVDGQGRSNGSAFAQVAPQAYATASQISVEHGLELARLGRGGVLAAPDDAAGPYTFASVLGRTSEIGGAAGIARARLDGHGVLGGLGWAGGNLSLGAFVGWTDNRQRLSSLGAKTDVDGVVAGVNARWRSPGGIGVTATVAYDGGTATTTRSIMTGSATGLYDLTAWTGDLAVDYAVALGGGWTLRPTLGATFIRARRDGVAEGGDTPFLLDVADRRQDWTFVDGTLDLRSRQGAGLRPWLNAGVRYRADGADPRALAALPGGPQTLAADGAVRAEVTGLLAFGAEVALRRGVMLFGALNGEAGKDASHGAAQAGLKIAF